MINGKRATPEDIYRIAIEEASVLAALYTGTEMRIRVANSQMLSAWGTNESVIGKPLGEALPELENESILSNLGQVFQTGKEYTALEERAELIVNGTPEVHYFNLTYKPLMYDDGTVWGIVHSATNVTSQVKTKIALEESERNFRNMIVQSPVAMAIYRGPDFIMDIINQPMLALIGKLENEVLHKPISTGLPEVKEEGYESILKTVFQSGTVYAAREKAVPLFRNGNLETAYIDFSYTPIRESNGIISGVLCVAVDVTDAVKSNIELQNSLFEKEIVQKEISEQKERLTQILETMAEGVGIIDLAGNITYANPMAQKILGLEQTDILTRTFNDPRWQNFRLDGSILPEEEHPMYIAMTTGKPVFDQEVAVQPVDGDTIYISINAAPIKDHLGNIVAGIGSFMDVTHRRKAIQQKDEFISVASHELKTPLTSLNAGFQLLERYLKTEANLPDKLISIANSTKINLRKLSLLVEDLLNATKIENGQLKLNKTLFVVAEVIDDCCDHIRLQGNHELRLSGDREIKIFADKQKIDQVIVNFVNNAVKYAPQSNIINLNIEADSENVKISVQDFGIGIAKEKAQVIFNRFYQVDNSSLQYAGLGLGLYISAEIIKQHGGHMGVDSELGKGSTFWFTIPKI